MMVAMANRGGLFQKYGPWAVVTGASDGIGKAIARELAAEGFNLVLVARRDAALRQLAQELELSFDTEIQILALDLSAPNAVGRISQETEDRAIGLLVAAAGFGTTGPFINNDVETELNMIDLNCRALAHVTHDFGRRFAAQKKGGIILFSSLVAFQGVPRSANYAATKAYVQSLAEGIYTELKPFGVDVLATAPGTVRTGFESRSNMKMSSAATPKEVARATLAALGKRRTVRPGFLAKLLGYSMSSMPRVGRIMLMAHIMKGMTREKLP
jgi:uncharacterized protein